jgi:molybdate transport system regulatory protein
MPPSTPWNFKCKPATKEHAVKLSARNQLPCTIKTVRTGPIHAEVTLIIGGTARELTAVITTASARRLGLKKGAPAVALIKSSSVILGVEE